MILFSFGISTKKNWDEPVHHKHDSSFYVYENLCLTLYALFFVIWHFYLINIFSGSPCCKRQHHGKTIHPTENFISMNLFKIIFVVIWEWLFVTSMVMETVKFQKMCTFWHSNLMFGSSQSVISKVLEPRKFENFGYKLC